MLNPNSINDDVKMLITCYLIGDIELERLEELKSWIAENKENEEYFTSCKDSWLISGVVSTKSLFDNTSMWERVQSHIDLEQADLLITEAADDNKFKIKRILRFAAIWIAVFACGGLVSYLVFRNQIVSNYRTEITVPYGTKTIAKLPDGSIVYLNAGSTLSYNQDFNKTKRQLHLSGEAYFNVATNKSKPFEVFTSTLIVRATGTKFNVKAYPNESVTTATLVEGKIDIRKRSWSKDDDGIELSPKQCLVYYSEKAKKGNSISLPNQKTSQNQQGNDDDKFTLYKNVKTELYTSWSQDNWVIESEALRTFAPKLERRYNMIIQFKDEEIKDYTFSGTIRKETIEQFLQALKLTTPIINYKIKKDTISLELEKQIKQK